MSYANSQRLYSLLVVSSLAATACAPTIKDRVKKLEDRVPKVERRVSDLEQTVNTLREKPDAESPIMLLKGKGYDTQFGMLLAKILDQYRDSDSRKVAETYANAITLVPTHDRNVYIAVIMVDKNGDGSPTPQVDRTLPDQAGGTTTVAFRLELDSLSDQVKAWLLNVTGIQQ